MFEKNATFQYIGNVTASGTTASALPAGSIALVNSAGTIITGATTSGKLRIAQKKDNGKLVYSPYFDVAKATNTNADYVASTEQLTYWGYNGTSGSLGTVAVGNLYTLSVMLRQTAPIVNNSPLIKTIPWTAESTTQVELASGIAGTFYRSFSREAYDMIRAEVVSAGAATANTGTGDLTVVKDSKGVVAATDVDAVAVVGDYLRFGTTEADAVYKIVAINATDETFTLDRPYRGASGTVAAANYEFVASAAAIAGAAGLSFTGLNRFAENGFDQVTQYYSKVRFNITSDDFDAGVGETRSTEATDGQGTSAQVGQTEIYTAMNEGQGRFLEAYPPTNYRKEVIAANTYDTVVINAVDNDFVSPTTGIRPDSTYTIVVRTKVSLAYEDLKTVLPGI